MKQEGCSRGGGGGGGGGGGLKDGLIITGDIWGCQTDHLKHLQ